MIKRILLISEDCEVTERSESEGIPSDHAGCVWIDVETSGDEDPGPAREWMASLGFTPRVNRFAVALRGRTRVVSGGEELYFEFPALAADLGSERAPLAFACRPGLCVTLHRGAVKGLSQTAERLKRDGAHGYDVSALVAELLAGLSSRAVDALDEIRKRVLELQDVMDRNPDEVDIAEVHDLSGSVRLLDAIAGERNVVLDRLRHRASPTVDLESNRDFQLALSDAQYLDRVVDRIEKRLTNLRDEYGLHQQERTNRRLAVLTVLSAIFLPLTLIAGIYGMNFETMPELAFRYAYPTTLGAMLLLAGGMVIFFRWRGWFD